MEQTNATGLSKFMKESVSKLVGGKNNWNEGALMLRELYGISAENVSDGEKEDYAEKLNMPTELLDVLMRAGLDVENKIAPDSKDMEFVKNLSFLTAALFTMSAATMRYIEINNKIESMEVQE